MGLTEEAADTKAKEVLARVRGVLERKVKGVKCKENANERAFWFRRMRKEGGKRHFIARAVFVRCDKLYKGVRITFPRIMKVSQEDRKAIKAVMNDLNKCTFGTALTADDGWVDCHMDFPSDYVDSPAFEENIEANLKTLKGKQRALLKDVWQLKHGGAGDANMLAFLLYALMQKESGKSENDKK